MELRSLHSEAMDLAEKAMIARAHGKPKLAQFYLGKAFILEKEAALGAVKENAPEPTRSVLLKSAAHLAIDLGELRKAEKLIGIALYGEPPEELAQELRALFEEVSFHRHLDLRGVELQSNDVQLVLLGHSIAPGMAASDEFIDRLSAMQRLVYRTSESDRGLDYRERGDPKQEIEKPLKLFVSVPRAASFAVSLKVASEKGQGELPFAESAEVLNRVIDRLGMFDRQDYEALRTAIPKTEYFENFIELASSLAPDGERVRLVGLTMIQDGKEKRLEMKRPAKADSKSSEFVPSKQSQHFFGRVFFINTKDQDNPVIKLEAEDGSDFRLKAEGDLLQKAVLYAGKRTRVAVKGIQVSKTVLNVEEFRASRGPIPKTRQGKKHR